MNPYPYEFEATWTWNVPSCAIMMPIFLKFFKESCWTVRYDLNNLDISPRVAPWRTHPPLTLWRHYAVSEWQPERSQWN
jgi:hypothetical protein